MPRLQSIRSEPETSLRSDQAITRILEADTQKFTELVKIAGLDPSRDFRYSNLAGVDFSGADLSGFDFTGASIEGATFDGALISKAIFTDVEVGLSQLRRAADWNLYAKGPGAIDSALRMGNALISTSAMYEDFLRQQVFPHPRSDLSKKDILRHQNVLKSEDALAVLLLVWKESHFVSEEALKRLNIQRTFDHEPVTAYGLAKRLATSVHDFGKDVPRVRSIVLSAEAFGLLDRDRSRSRGGALHATERLNQFIVEFTISCRDRFSALGLSLNQPKLPA